MTVMMSDRQMSDTDHRELRKLTRWWQKRLKLNHWDIEVNYVRGRDMNLAEKAGEIQWNASALTAWISIRDPVDIPASSFQHDMEITLVHELLHLWLFPFQPKCESGQKHVALEQAINRIAEALVAVKRQSDRKAKKRSA